MIIKRIAEGIKKQDWFVVIIEVMIVVIGIFLGIQVTEWNDARKDDLRALEILIDLRSDFEVIDESAQDLISYYHALIDDMKILIVSVRNSKLVEENHSAIQNALTYGGTYGDPPPPSGVFRELVSSGNLSLIQSKDLRFRLMEYDHSIGIIISSDMAMHSMLAPFTVAFTRYSSIELSVAEISDGDLSFIDVQSPGVSGFDFEGMTSDPEFLAASESHLSTLYSRLINISVAQSKIRQINDMLSANVTEANQ